MLKISVAMAVFNGERYVEEQLDSILHQIRQPDEVIIVDDCSDDMTFEIIEKYIEKNNLISWKLYGNESNVGYKRNFHKAISLTSGDIVFTSDQDDVWCADKLESIAGLFAKYDRVKAVATSFLLIDGDGNAIERSQKGNYGLIKAPLKGKLQRIRLKTVMHSNISPGCTSAFRREVAELYLRNSDGVIPHDYEINLIAASLGGLYFYDAPLIKYRLHHDNTTGLDGKKQTRTEIASEKCEAASVIMKNTADSKVFEMYDIRLKALTAGNLTELLPLFFNRDYNRFLSFCERLGDLIYILRSGK